MNLDSVPLWVLFLGTILVIAASIEVGRRLGGRARSQSEDEKEAPVSGVSGAVLGLTAFILAFTFSIVTDRFDARKALVREDANAIRVAFLRATFLPEADRIESKGLLKEYLDRRLAFAQSESIADEHLAPVLAVSDRIQQRLWSIAVTNARRDMNSDVAALYIESLNELFNVHAVRLAVGVQERIPIGIWAVLYGLMALGMLSIGYHAGIVESKRSNAMVLLATSFALVISLIASLDRPGGFISVTQQPLLDLKAFISSEKMSVD